MSKFYDSGNCELEKFDGKFVYDRKGKRRYWIDDGEVFSISAHHCSSGSITRACIKIAEMTNGIATASDGAILFSLR